MEQHFPYLQGFLAHVLTLATKKLCKVSTYLQGLRDRSTSISTRPTLGAPYYSSANTIVTGATFLFLNLMVLSVTHDCSRAMIWFVVHAYSRECSVICHHHTRRISIWYTAPEQPKTTVGCSNGVRGWAKIHAPRSGLMTERKFLLIDFVTGPRKAFDPQAPVMRYFFPFWIYDATA